MSDIFNPLCTKVSSPLSFSSSSSSSSSHNKGNITDSVFERAQSLAKKFEGECLSSHFSICKGKNAIKFRCLNGHTFFVSADVIPTIIPTVVNESCSDCWCYKCKKFLESCKEVALNSGLQVIEGLFSSKITLRCDKQGHKFKISYSKKLNSLSCSDCRREEREEWKETLRQEEQRRNEVHLLKQ